MFERLLKELKKLEREKQISVPVRADKDGYLDRECPNEECMFQFKVDENDWTNIFNDDIIYCPRCRHEANSDSWWTKEQLEFAEDQVTKHVIGRIGNALKKGAKEFNTNQPRNSFIKMSVTVKGTSPYHYILPIPAKEEMQLKVVSSNLQCTKNGK